MSKEAWEKFIEGNVEANKPLTKMEFKALMMGFMEWVKTQPGRPEAHISCHCPACRPELWERE